MRNFFIKLSLMLFIILMPVVSVIISGFTLKRREDISVINNINSIKENRLTELYYDNGINDADFSPFSENKNVSAAVLFTLPDVPKKLHYIKVYITRSGKYDTPFKIKIYDVSDELLPGKNLLNKNIIVNAVSGNEWITVDLSKYNIVIDRKNIFVAVEWTASPGSDGKRAQFVGFSLDNPRNRSWINCTGDPFDWIHHGEGLSKKGNFLIRLIY